MKKKISILLLMSLASMIFLFGFAVALSASPINIGTKYVYKETSTWGTSLRSSELRFSFGNKYTVKFTTDEGTEKYTGTYDINGDEIRLQNWAGNGDGRPITLIIKNKKTLSSGYTSETNGWEVFCWIGFCVLLIGNIYYSLKHRKRKKSPAETIDENENA